MEIVELKSQLATSENHVTSLQTQVKQEEEYWKKQLQLVDDEKERVLKDKDTLLEEVSAIIVQLVLSTLVVLCNDVCGSFVGGCGR